MRVETVEVLAGEHIDVTVQKLVAVATDHKVRAKAVFNDIPIAAYPHDDPSNVLRKWMSKFDRRRIAYANSAEGVEAEARHAAEVRRMQSLVHELMQELATLDFSEAATLDWMARLQEPSDYVSVDVPVGEILMIFERHGLVPNMNVGDNFRDGDQRNEFEYIIGQCLNGLDEYGAIHHIVHKFVDDWRSRYL